MPLFTNNVTLGTAAQMVVPPRTQGQKVYLHNMTKSSNRYIHLGPSNINLNNSIHIDPGESITLELGPGDDLYAFSDPSGLPLGILAVIQD
jgi:hypothetical protein